MQHFSYFQSEKEPPLMVSNIFQDLIPCEDVKAETSIHVNLVYNDSNQIWVAYKMKIEADTTENFRRKDSQTSTNQQTGNDFQLTANLH